jgi:hypothetical protein
MKTTHLILFSLSILLFANCKQASRARQIQPDIQRSMTESRFSSRGLGDSILFHYIGCGGFLIRRGNEAVLIDPYFSNAEISKNPFQTLKTDTALVDDFFKNNFKNARDTEGVIQTVLIAHAHHDHLADLPSLMKRNLLTPKITVIGSGTVGHLLASFHLPFDAKQQMVSFDSIFEAKNNPKPYTSPSGRVRITAFKTEHAPHVLGRKLPFIGGNITKTLEKSPKTSLGFKEGMNYNFMIDFLNADGTIGFRVFSSAGAAANAPIGFPTPSVKDEKTVDVLLLCGANYDQVKGYPEGIVSFIKPKKIFVAHWENFFVPIPSLLKKPLVVPLTDIPKFLTILKKTMLENHIEPTPIIVPPLTKVIIKF